MTLVGSSRSKGFTYELEFVPFGEVVPGQCVFEGGAVGRGTLTLKKRQRAKWPRLVEDADAAAKLPMHTWWDRQEEYREELAALDQVDEDMKVSPNKAPQEGIDVKKAPSDAAEADSADDDSAPARSPLVAFGARVGAWLRAKLAGLGLKNVVLKLDDAKASYVNFADGWKGDVKDFATRQTDRALSRAAANASSYLAALDAEEKARKKVITDETKAEIAEKSKNLSSGTPVDEL